MAALRLYSIGLLLAGIGLIAGSCVPLVQTFLDTGSAPLQRLALPPGTAAPLHVAEDLTVAPVVLINLLPDIADAAAPMLPYKFSIRDASDGVLVEENGTAALASADERPGGGGSSQLRLRFRELTIPAGSWRVELDAGTGAGLIQAIELRLLDPSPGLMPALMTTLVLAILGWLAASLGALQWIRAAAAHPAREGDGTADDERVRMWTVGCHLSALLGYVLPFGHLLGPLAVWLSKRHTMPAIERAGRSALNFQLSVTLYVLTALLLSFFLIGIVVLFAVAVFHFAVVLYAALRAQRGLDVVYPFSLRFI